jgi:hypothetical protein
VRVGVCVCVYFLGTLVHIPGKLLLSAAVWYLIMPFTWYYSNAGKFAKEGSVDVDVAIVTVPDNADTGAESSCPDSDDATGTASGTGRTYLMLSVSNVRIGDPVVDTEQLFIPFRSTLGGMPSIKGPSMSHGM